MGNSLEHENARLNALARDYRLLAAKHEKFMESLLREYCKCDKCTSIRDWLKDNNVSLVRVRYSF